MKLSSVSRAVVVGRFGLGGVGLALTLGLVSACGDDSNTSTPPVDVTGDAASSSSGADGGADPGTSGPQGETPSGSANGGSNDGGGSGLETRESTGGSADDGGASGETCGGGGQACCAAQQCNGGFVCVAGAPESAVTDAGAGPNLAESDAGFGGGRPRRGVAVDAGGAARDASADAPMPSAGMCEPCGGEGDLCCAEDACDDGLSCETVRPWPDAPRSCVASPAATDDAGRQPPVLSEAGATASCGSEGAQCCDGRRGGDPTCDEGLSCDDPFGDGLDNSTCVAPEGQGESDAGACGAVGQPCCAGRRGQGECNDGLDCESNAPRGLEGDLCVSP